MELATVNDVKTRPVGDMIPAVIEHIEVVSTGAPFIEANTIHGSLEQMKDQHIIPVFIKDNEPVISHAEFIEATYQAAKSVFSGEVVMQPNIRLSHPIKGRVPDARNKPANELLDHEKTLYYERMAFVIEVPTIYTDVAGNRLHLTLGGVKAYNLDNLYNRSGADQHFKVFVGFKNLVCTNLCVSTDGYLSNLKVKTLEQLYMAVNVLLAEFDAATFGQELSRFQNQVMTGEQFVSLIGRSKLYRFMPDNLKEGVTELSFGDSQINTVCRDYYNGTFAADSDGSIDLWRLYNLFTGANKSTYIDNFLDRSQNAFQLVREIGEALSDNRPCWYIN